METASERIIHEVVSRAGHPMFYELLVKMADLHSQKNHDYAGARDPLENLRACTKLIWRGEPIPPFIGVLVRLQDKWDRILNFVEQGELQVKTESIEDTLMDNAVYSLLAIILLREAAPTIPPKDPSHLCTNCKYQHLAGSKLPCAECNKPARSLWEPKDEAKKTTNQ